MKLFMLNFLLIYGAAHAYFLLSLLKAFSVLRNYWAVPFFWCLLMTLIPIIVRVLEQRGLAVIASILAYPGYFWMGLLFIFISISVVMQFTRLLLRVLHFFVFIPQLSFFSARPFFLICFCSALMIACYGYYEATHLKIESIVLPTDKIPKGNRGIRIVQISDLHVGLIVGAGQVQQVIDSVKRLKPDLFVATGDIVDGHIKHFDGISQMFRTIAPPMGMIAIFGNHEYYAGIDSSRSFLEQSGFRLLQDQALLIGNNLALVGVDDPASARFGKKITVDEGALLEALPKERFIVLLKHRPEIGDNSAGKFDLQLSGHVHKGQIFPFNLLTWLRFPVHTGITRLSAGGHLYVSRGTGTWGPPIRFMAPPELTVIDLVPYSF